MLSSVSNADRTFLGLLHLLKVQLLLSAPIAPSRSNSSLSSPGWMKGSLSWDLGIPCF